MEVRAANEGDLEAVSLLNASVQSLHHEARPDWFVPPDHESIKSWLAATLDRDDAYIVVADDEGDVVGYALATLHHRPRTPFTHPLSILELDQIGVEDGARRSGIGSSLVRRIAELAQELGVDRVMLTVWDFNGPARAAFRSRAFGDVMHRMELSDL